MADALSNMEKLNDYLKNANIRVQKLNEAFLNLNKGGSVNQEGYIERIKKIGEGYSLSAKQVQQFTAAVSDMASKASGKTRIALSSVIKDLTTTYGKLNELSIGVGDGISKSILKTMTQAGRGMGTAYAKYMSLQGGENSGKPSFGQWYDIKTAIEATNAVLKEQRDRLKETDAQWRAYGKSANEAARIQQQSFALQEKRQGKIYTGQNERPPLTSKIYDSPNTTKQADNTQREIQAYNAHKSFLDKMRQEEARIRAAEAKADDQANARKLRETTKLQQKIDAIKNAAISSDYKSMRMGDKYAADVDEFKKAQEAKFEIAKNAAAKIREIYAKEVTASEGSATRNAQMQEANRQANLVINSTKQAIANIDQAQIASSKNRIEAARAEAKEREQAIRAEAKKREQADRRTEAINTAVHKSKMAQMAVENTALSRNAELAKKAAKERGKATSRAVGQIKNVQGNDSLSSLQKTKEIQRITQELSKTLSNINKKYNDQAAAIEQNNRRIKHQQERVSSLFSAVKRLGAAFGVAFSVRGLAQFGKKLIEIRGEFQMQQVALQSIIQNKSLADEIYNKTMAAALQSPFTAMQLTKYTKQLAAYRIESSKLFDTTKMLADVSAGLGVDMQRLILAYGQVKAANYLRASEIRQFTEAGVNILGELSKRFSELKGRAVSTAEVMEMVQKRMVKFEAVDSIFKSMTSSGGMFYNMQLIQSQTVKGQVNKLHDAYDQMLNSIGGNNEGILRNVVMLLNKMIVNWRLMKVAIASVGVGVMTNMLFKLCAALRGTELAMTATGKSAKKLAVSLKVLSKSITNNPIFLAVSVIATAITALITLSKRMKDENRDIDKMASSNIQTVNSFEKLKDEIEKNNRVIKDGSSSTEELSKAQSSNAAIVARLKSEYPEIAKNIKDYNGGVLNLNNALEIQIRKTKELIALQFTQKQKGFLSDTQTTNIKESGEEEMKATALAYNMQAAADLKLAMAESNKLKLTEKEKGVLEKISKTDISATDVYEVLKSFRNEAKALETVVTTRGTKITTPAIVALEHLLGIGSLSYSKRNTDTALEQIKKNTFPILINSIKSGLRDSYKTAIEESGKDVFEWLQDNWDMVLNDINSGKADPFANMRSMYGAVTPGLKNLINSAFNAMDGVNTRGIDYFATVGYNNNPNNDELEEREKAANRAADQWRKRISLIEEMRKRYEELSKSAYGYVKSDKEVRKSFEESFKEIFAGTGISMKDIDFSTREAMYKSIRSTIARATGIKEDVRKELLKKADTWNAQVPINIEVKIRNNFVREIEDMLKDHELTLEVQGLNISKEAMKDLFPDSKYTTLGMIQDKMEEFRKKRMDEGNFSEEDLNTYKKYAEKVEAELLKERKERAKQYSKYLEKEYSERAKLEMQHASDVAFVEANFSNDAQRNSIIANINKKYQQDLNELNWKSFKESDFYVEMMDDITSLPVEYTKMMLDKIEEILQHPETLSPRALKEAIKARQKVLEAQMKTTPLKVAGESLKGMRNAKGRFGGSVFLGSTSNRLDNEIVRQQKYLNSLEEEHEMLDTIKGDMEEYEKAVAGVNDAKGKLSSGIYASVNTIEEAKAKKDSLSADLTSKEKALRKLVEKETELTEEESNLKGKLETSINSIKAYIYTIDAFIAAMMRLNSISNQQEGSQAEVNRNRGISSDDIGGLLKENEDKVNSTKANLQQLKGWSKDFTDFYSALTQFAAFTNSVIDSVQKVGEAWYEMYDAVGKETNVLTDAWRDFGVSMAGLAKDAISLFPQMAAGIQAISKEITAASMSNIIGLIAQAAVLVMKAVTAMAKLHDAKYEKVIEDQQKRIEELQKAYERLQKQIEKTWTSIDYVETYNKAVENINERIEATNKKLSAERDKKNSDQDKIDGYNEEIDELKDNLEELKDDLTDVFGGIGEKNYRSTAEGFVSAWKEAFLETGDGLEALQDHFDEFLQEWFVKQATMRVAGKMLENTFGLIDKAVAEDGDGSVAVTAKELQDIRAEFARVSPLLADALGDLADMFDVSNDGSLSGLAASIQGMTEEQANVLEGYFNSIRLYTSSIDTNVAKIAAILGAGGDATNPQLQQLEMIARNTALTNTLLSSATKSGHSRGGVGFKVFSD